VVSSRRHPAEHVVATGVVTMVPWGGARSFLPARDMERPLGNCSPAGLMLDAPGVAVTVLDSPAAIRTVDAPSGDGLVVLRTAAS